MTLASFADWVTVVGFLATLWVLYVTTSLRRSVLSRARIPEIRSDLEKLGGNLLKAMQAEKSDDIESSCSRIHSALEAATGKTAGTNKKRISALTKKIEATKRGRNFDIESIKPIYSDLVGITEMLKNIEKDVSWRL